MFKQPNVLTPRLILRPFELSDTNKVQKFAGNAHIAMSSANIPYPYEDGMAGLWIGSHSALWQKREAAHFAIVEKSSTQLIGCVSLQNISFSRAQLGYWVAEAHWNKGYGTEAAKAAINFGFEQFNLDCIYAQHLSKDTRPGKVLEKIGMRHVSTKRDAVRIEHVSEDVEYYEIERLHHQKMAI
ncbi:GNAT family N-acetyltransferase [Thaumasiovibrio subtropicus]|uniref:GNAT family N-acetyltransferase n=1 Tax=Thaumasiovibrio subtropicus TaxID=1891207 RepID=UPI000B34CEE5|nr:GNAT family N-acetyltransferase [Thaumasiovibrio subtropicus]